MDSHPVRPIQRFREFRRAEVHQSIPARFESQVRKHPHRLAVRVSDDELTYELLNRSANRLAHSILERFGDRPEPVAFLLGQQTNLAVAILGILKAGKYYVPLDPALPAGQITDILHDLEARALVTSSRWLQHARELVPSRMSVLDLDGIEAGRASQEDPWLSIPPDAFAYVFFTSGSTGRPKGVLDNHRNVLHNIMRYTNTLHFSADDRFTLLQAPGFSGSVSSLFGALLNGAAVFPYDIRKEGVAPLVDLLARERITLYHSVPSVFRLIAPMGRRFPDLRLIRLEGDRVTPRDVALYQAHFAESCLLVNGLGATECGIVRQYFMATSTTLVGGNVPIGYAVPDMEITLLDSFGNSIPAGEIGEIAVCSEYLAVGYWHRPDLTEKAFSADRSETGARVYRTGDLGRFLPDGCLQHLGRRDAQVKVHGMHVNLEDLALALVETTGVEEAVVLPGHDSSNETRLTAYVRLRAGDATSVSELRQRLATRIPDFMVPSSFVCVEEMPTSRDGKIDRQALSALPALGHAPQSFLAPRDAVENRLLLLWQKLLRAQGFGVRDDFWNLGGDSLTAVKLVHEIAIVFDRQLAPADLLDSRTIEDLAVCIQQESPSRRSSLVPLCSGGFRPPIILVPGAGASAVQFVGLARHLGPDQPLYALEPLGISGDETPHSRMEDMARHYVEEIRNRRIYGPVVLVGSCFGSLVAFEMAQQLWAVEPGVARVVMLGDALVPPWVRKGARPPGQGLSLGHALRRSMYHLRHTSLGDVLRTAWAESRTMLQPARRTHREILEAHNWARLNYRPRSFPGPVIYIRLRPRRQPSWGELIWQRLAEGGFHAVEVSVVSDKWHQEPYVRHVAATLQNCLDAGASRTSTTDSAAGHPEKHFDML